MEENVVWIWCISFPGLAPKTNWCLFACTEKRCSRENKIKIKNIQTEQNRSGKITLTCSPLHARAHSCMSGGKVEAGQIMWILFWWHRFPFFNQTMGIGGWLKRCLRKKNHIAALITLTKTLKGFTAKLITLYPGSGNNAASCLSEQYSLISVWLLFSQTDFIFRFDCIFSANEQHCINNRKAQNGLIFSRRITCTASTRSTRSSDREFVQNLWTLSVPNPNKKAHLPSEFKHSGV